MTCAMAPRRRRRPGAATALLLALLAAALLPRATRGQGLAYDPNAAMGATAAQLKLEQIYAKSKAWKDAFKSSPSTCSTDAGSLCGAAGDSMAASAQLMMATSPQAFDARRDNGDFSAVGPIKNQLDCNACVSFAVLAAAHSALATATKRSATGTLSESDLFFCRSLNAREDRTCSSTWTLLDGIETFMQLDASGAYPVNEKCMPYKPSQMGAVRCSYACKESDPMFQTGRFRYVKLDSPWQVQEHIRTHGSVITGVDIYSDFRPFFASNPKGTYPGPGPKATFELSHAVQIVGYDLDKQSWLVRNSWGSEFADGGYFRIGFGKAAIAGPSRTYGLRFEPYLGPPKPSSRLSAIKGRPGCYSYKALPTDYVSKLAGVWGVSIQSILLENKDNAAVRQAPDAYLKDQTITLCGISAEAAKGAMQVSADAAGVAPAVAAAKAPGGTAMGAVATYDPLPGQVVAAAGAPTAKLPMGSYAGYLQCDGMPGRVDTRSYFERDPKTGTYSGGITSKYNFMNMVDCKWETKSELCTIVKDTSHWVGSGAPLCKDQEAWECPVSSFPRWDDTCGGVPVPKATLFRFCYGGGTSVESSYIASGVKCTYKYTLVDAKAAPPSAASAAAPPPPPPPAVASYVNKPSLTKVATPAGRFAGLLKCNTGVPGDVRTELIVNKDASGNVAIDFNTRYDMYNVIKCDFNARAESCTLLPTLDDWSKAGCPPNTVEAWYCKITSTGPWGDREGKCAGQSVPKLVDSRPCFTSEGVFQATVTDAAGTCEYKFAPV